MHRPSPTPAPRGHGGSEYHRTMEQRVSRTQDELEQLKSARSSGRSLSVTENDQLHKRIYELEIELQKAKNELYQKDLTIKIQSETISKTSSTPNRPYMPSKPISDDRMDFGIPGPSVLPPRFDPHGTISGAQNARSSHPNDFSSPLPLPQNYQSRSLPPPSHQNPSSNPYRNQSRYQQNSYQSQSTFQPEMYQPQGRRQVGGQTNYGSPSIQSPLPGTLGFGLTVSQKPQPAAIYDGNRAISGTSHQAQPSQSSYGPGPSQSTSNQVSYSSQSSYGLPQQQSNTTSNQSTSTYGPLQRQLHKSSNQAMSTALVIISNTAQELGFPEKFEKLFTMSERYAYAHVNFPSAAKDAMLSSYVKDKLQSIGGSYAGQLMSNGQTRYYMVARIINQWLCKHVLKRTVFCGFEAKVDATIKELGESIYQTTPHPVRGQLLNQICEEVGGLKNGAMFEVFFYKICKDRGNDLWAVLKPMMHQKTSKDWEDLMLLMIEAHNIAGAMLGGPYEWRFDFNNPTDVFRQRTMTCKDPFMKSIGPEEKETRGAVVRLGVSPLVGFRTYKKTSGMEASNVLSASVLTKWPWS